MHSSITRWAAPLGLVLSLFGPGALAQCQSNTNNNCQLGALPQDGTTVYYAPDDSGNIEFFGQAIGSCDPGSTADVTFYATFQDSSAGNFITDCGCLPLDGNTHVLDCGVPKGTIPEGAYHFDIALNVNYAGLDRFNIVHHQETETAATPTSTVTTYSTETDTITVTSTQTDTATRPQATVTTPAGTVQQTVTITPTVASSTTTSTKTYTQTDIAFAVFKKTITKTVCKTPKACPTTRKSGGHHLEVRQQNGYTVTGDGPPTTTVTPDPSIVTETDDGGTTTETDTAVVTSTTTVDPTPPTTTVFAGSATNVQTTTLAQSTTTITARTTTHKTVTKTISIIFKETTTKKVFCTRKPLVV